MDGLMTAINLHRGYQLVRRQKEAIEGLEYGLTVALDQLADEFRIRELDIKIAQMQRVLDVVRKPPAIVVPLGSYEQ